MRNLGLSSVLHLGEMVMSDQWRANVTTIAGQPVAVVELNIKRTFLIDAQMWQNVEKIIKGNGDNYEGLGAGNLVEIVSLIYNLPPEARPYFSVPWSEEASLHLAEMPLAQLMKLTERDAFFRVEGSAQAGFVGYMTIGGQDRKVDLSEANIPNVLAAIDQTIAEAEADRAAARITPDEEKVIKEFCESMRQPTVQCRDEMIKMREWQRQRDAKPDRPPSGAGGRGDWGGWRPEATHTGDFGRGFEGRMGNVA